MRITNTTDIAKGTGVKIVAIGPYRVMPGETIEIPDNIAYVFSKGEKKILPAIVAQARTNQIRYEETAPVSNPLNDVVYTDAKNEERATEKTVAPAVEKVLTDEEKKAAAAAKRAATRAANKAAAEAAAAAKAE